MLLLPINDNTVKAIHFTIALFISVLSIYAAPVDKAKASFIAETFYTKTIDAKGGTPQLAYTATADNKNTVTDCFYIYNIGSGFVIVSADDRIKPILGYSRENNFDPDNIPEGVRALFDGYTKEIVSIMQNIAEPDMTMKEKWTSLTDGTFSPVRSGQSVLPLLDDSTGINNWQQNNGYNYYCPADAAGPAGKCYVGCCALAMGQVMHYWKHPAQGTGTHSYDCNHSTYLQGQYGDYGTLTVDFGNTTYDFANMPNYLDGSTPSYQILAVAKLLYHAGVSIDMWYGNKSSMGFHTDIASGLETYFKYDTCLTVWRNSYSGDWISFLKEDLDLGRPIIYCAYTDGGAGHEFVCDGYDEYDFFHFNMGWGGNYNNYYSVDNLNAQYNFTSSHGAVAHIRPKVEPENNDPDNPEAPDDPDTPENPDDNDNVNENSNYGIKIYPNPATDNFVIECDGFPFEYVRIIDVYGRIVMQSKAADNTKFIGISSLPSGIYFVQIIGNKGIVTKKLNKK
ncbi:MAG: thiol protease/hemagglutinin PrtT [Bacteroidales bacterium]|nr:thiol protease/hemagglutinin PrtT [Bacteroidales bacterium]